MTDAANNDRLEALWAEAEIARINQQYAHALDTLDFDALRACFHPDAKLHYGDAFSGSLPEALDWLRTQLPKLRGTMHGFLQPRVELDLAAGTASCRTYALNTTRYPETPDGVRLQTVGGTLYTDRFELRDGAWLIAERRNEGVWSHTAPETEIPPVP